MTLEWRSRSYGERLLPLPLRRLLVPLPSIWLIRQKQTYHAYSTLLAEYKNLFFRPFSHLSGTDFFFFKYMNPEIKQLLFYDSFFFFSCRYFNRNSKCFLYLHLRKMPKQINRQTNRQWLLSNVDRTRYQSLWMSNTFKKCSNRNSRKFICIYPETTWTHFKVECSAESIKGAFILVSRIQWEWICVCVNLSHTRQDWFSEWVLLCKALDRAMENI